MSAGVGPAIRVAIVEDHRLVADAMATMFSLSDGFEVVGRAESGTDAVELARRVRPDVMLMDVTLVGLNGIEATRRIATEAPGTRVLVLTMHDDEDTVAGAVAAGAAGFLPKNAEREELFRAVRSLAAGEAFLHGRAAQRLLSRIAPLMDDTLAGGRLTDREGAVLALLAEGRATKEIARSLHLAEETVKSHLSRIYQKLGVTDRTQAVAVAIRRGLVP